MLVAANPACAIQEDNETPQETTPTINKNILTPNESPGIMTDTEKARRYYESLEDAHRTDLNILEGEAEIIHGEIKLPERLNVDAPTTHIDRVEFSAESEIFSEFEIEKFKSLIENQDVTAEDLNNLVKIINEQYKLKKVLTAQASLESLEGGVLKIELMEARIGKITVEGNKFNRKWFIKKMLTARADQVLNLATLEEDLRRFNKNARSVKLSAELKPGEKYGTTDIVIKAEEKLPYHFSTSWDSFGRETTGLLRGGLMVSADSVFGFQDRLTTAINLARGSVSPYVDYNVPVNKYGTRAGASYMLGNSKVISGEYDDKDLESKTHIFSGYVTHPIVDKEKYSLSASTSANIKLSDASIFNYKYSDYKDYNLAVGLSGRYNFNKSVLYGSIYSTNGLINNSIVSSTDFFTKINADGYYIHYLPKGIIGTVRAGGQYTPMDIPYIEQYQIGGMSSVRGYSESLLLASNSYFASLEMLFPLPFLPEEIKIPFRKDGAKYRLRDSFKFATFVDTGAIFPNYEGAKIDQTSFLLSAGAGFRIAISKYLSGRLYLGVPILNSSYYDQATCRIHFDIVASPF